MNLDNVAKQRQLNDKGRDDARTSVSVQAEPAYRSVGRTRAGSSNTLIVTHKPNILDALGRDWFDIREGEASIFKPDGVGGHALVGRVQIGQWATAK